MGVLWNMMRNWLPARPAEGSAARPAAKTESDARDRPQLNQKIDFSKVDSPLLAYRRSVTSQCGEDGLIEKIVELIEPASRYCVEFGAWDGKEGSNCYNLTQNHGWGGLMIEAAPGKFRELQQLYAGNARVATMNRLVDFDGANALDRLLDEAGAPSEIGVLSIDIDGNDYYVWEAMTRHSAALVVVEFNPSVPNDVRFIQAKSFEVNQGCSLLSLVELAKAKGYELAVCTEFNACFVKQEKFGVLGVADNHITRLYRPLQDGRIFQGYDGTIHIAGMNQLLWRRDFPLSSADFQVLAAGERTWGDAQK